MCEVQLRRFELVRKGRKGGREEDLKGKEEEEQRKKEKKGSEKSCTYIELGNVAEADFLALTAELVEEEEPAEAIAIDEGGKAEEGDGGDDGEGELDDGVEGASVGGVAGGAGQEEVGEGGGDVGEEEE